MSGCGLISAGDLAEKTTVYSALVGILNARKFDVGEEVSVLIGCYGYEYEYHY